MCCKQTTPSVFALVGGVCLTMVAAYGQPVQQPALELPGSESRPAIRSTLPMPEFQARTAAIPVKLPFACVENRGQWDTAAKYVARTSGAAVRFEKDAIVLHRESRDAKGRIEHMLARLRFEGASDTVILEGQKRQRGVYNYFLGNDRSKWKSRVPGYSELLYRGLYDGVDLRVRKVSGRLEYDVLLAPGADVSQVVIHAEGIEGLGIEPDGSLRIDTNLGPIHQALPTTW